MPVPITPADVIEVCPALAELPEAVIDRYICIVDQADECLDNCDQINDCQIELLKIYAVCHLAWVSNPITMFKSNTSPTKESVTNFDIAQQTGLNSTTFGRQVRMMDACGCLIDILENGQNERFIEVAGS